MGDIGAEHSDSEQTDALGGSVGDGRYVFETLLGEGGMAAVHRAHDTRLDRPVAVKTMHTELGREASFRQRFQREAQTVARLNHPNVVAVYDSGEQRRLGGGAPIAYMVMEYVEGESLRAALQREVGTRGAMPVQRALAVVRDVLSALDVSHEHGMVHRDIKPDNVMLTRRGEVKVMDFGIARAQQSGVTSLTQTGAVVGTPHYLSPEQAEGVHDIDGRSDLYAVGVLLFQLLSGQLPFDGDSMLSIAVKHIQASPPALSECGAQVPPAVQALVSRALAKQPNERFPSAEAMRDELDRASGHAAAGAGTPPAATRHDPSVPSWSGDAAGPPAQGSPSPPPASPPPPSSPPPAPPSVGSASPYARPPQAAQAPPPGSGQYTPQPPPGSGQYFPQPPGPYGTPYPQQRPYPQPQQSLVPPGGYRPYPQPGGYPHPGGYPTGAPPSNGKAIAGVVLGVLSWPTAFLFGIGVLGTLVGLPLSISALRDSRKRAGYGRGIAIAGIVLNAVMLVGGALLFLIILGSVTGSSSDW